MMKLKDFFSKIFRKERAEVQESLKAETQEEVRAEEPVEHDYLNCFELATNLMFSNGYGWKQKPFKKVTLTNVKDCENKISVLSVAASWNGTGHYEWELLLASNFVRPVVEALLNGSDEADISTIFRCELLHASGERVFSQEAIYGHLIPFFEIESETDEELRLAIKIE